MKNVEGQYELPPVRFPRWLSISMLVMLLVMALSSAYAAVWRPGSEISQFASMVAPIIVAVVGSYWSGLNARR